MEKEKTQPPKAQAPKAKKAKKGGSPWPVYVLAVVLILDVALLFLPVTLPVLGTWSMEYAFASGTVLVAIALVYISHKVVSGLGGAVGRMEEKSSTLGETVSTLVQRVEQLAPDSAAKSAALEAAFSKVAKGVEGLGGSLAAFEKGSSDSAKRTAVMSEMVVGLQSSLGEVEKKLTAIEAAGTESKGVLESLEYRMGAAEQASETLTKSVSMTGESAREAEKMVGESREQLASLGKTLGQVQTRLAGLEESSAGASDQLAEVSRAQASLSKMEKTVSKMEERIEKLAKVEGGLSRVEKSLSKIDSGLAKVARQQGGRGTPAKRAQQGARRGGAASARAGHEEEGSPEEGPGEASESEEREG